LAASEITGIAPGVTHVRCVVLTQGIVVVLDRITGQQSHTFDFVYHNLGQMTPVSPWTATPHDQSLGSISNYQNLIDVAKLQGSGPVRLSWDLTGNVVPPPANRRNPQPPAPPAVAKLDFWHLPVSGGSFFTAVTGMNNTDTNRMPDTAPTLIHRVTGQQAFFATAMQPHRGESKIKNIRASGNEGVTVEFTSGQSITLNLGELIQKYRVKD